MLSNKKNVCLCWPFSMLAPLFGGGAGIIFAQMTDALAAHLEIFGSHDTVIQGEVKPQPWRGELHEFCGQRHQRHGARRECRQRGLWRGQRERSRGGGALHSRSQKEQSGLMKTLLNMVSSYIRKSNRPSGKTALTPFAVKMPLLLWTCATGNTIVSSICPFDP